MNKNVKKLTALVTAGTTLAVARSYAEFLKELSIHTLDLVEEIETTIVDLIEDE